MRVTELQRKSALLRFHLRNQGAYVGKTTETIPLLNGMTRAGFEKWLSGETENPRTLEEVSSCIKRTLGIDEPHNLFSLDVGVMHFGHLLGLTRSQCRYAIDELAGEVTPTFSIFSIDRTRAEHLMDEYRGLYLIYRWENTEQATRFMGGRERNIMVMPMAIRYSLPGSKAMSEGMHRIRCKLNIRSYRRALTIHEYDGHLTPPDNGGIHYWVLEKRHETPRDMVLMVTGELEQLSDQHEERSFAIGTMMSQNQDRCARPTVWPIAIEHIDNLPAEYFRDDEDGDDYENRFTRDQARLADPDDLDPVILQKLQEAQDYSAFMRDEVTPS